MAAALRETIELSLEARDHANLAYALDLLASAEHEAALLAPSSSLALRQSIVRP